MTGTSILTHNKQRFLNTVGKNERWFELNRSYIPEFPGVDNHKDPRDGRDGRKWLDDPGIGKTLKWSGDRRDWSIIFIQKPFGIPPKSRARAGWYYCADNGVLLEIHEKSAQQYRKPLSMIRSYVAPSMSEMLGDPGRMPRLLGLRHYEASKSSIAQFWIKSQIKAYLTKIGSGSPRGPVWGPRSHLNGILWETIGNPSGSSGGFWMIRMIEEPLEDRMIRVSIWSGGFWGYGGSGG